MDLGFNEAVGQGKVPKPPLMHQKRWLTWRSSQGRRPAVKRTGEVGTGMAEEMALWKAAMEHCFGENWPKQLMALIHI